MVQAARRYGVEKRQTIAYLVGDISMLPFREASFDGVAMLGQVLPHVPGRERRVETLRSVWRILRPGGKLAMTTHNRRCHWKFRLYFALVNSMRRLARRLGYDSMLGDNDRWSARISQSSLGQPVFFHMYDLDEAVADLEAAGFEVLEAKTRSALEAGSSEPARRIKDYLLGFVARRPAG
jgi:SAM-dependent methyltransferase